MKSRIHAIKHSSLLYPKKQLIPICMSVPIGKYGGGNRLCLM